MKSRAGVSPIMGIAMAILAITVVVLLAVMAQGRSSDEPHEVPALQPGQAQSQELHKRFEEVLAAYRKVIVLLVYEDSLPAKEQEACNQVAQGLFHENLARIDLVSGDLEKLISAGDAGCAPILHWRPIIWDLFTTSRRSIERRLSGLRILSRWIPRAIAYINLGDAYAKTNQPAKARQAFLTYLELAPAGNNAAYSRQQLQEL